MKDFYATLPNDQYISSVDTHTPINERKKGEKEMKNILWIDLNSEITIILDTIVSWLWMNAINWENTEHNLRKQITIIMEGYFWANTSYKKVPTQVIENASIAIWVELVAAGGDQETMKQSVLSWMRPIINEVLSLKAPEIIKDVKKSATGLLLPNQGLIIPEKPKLIIPTLLDLEQHGKMVVPKITDEELAEEWRLIFPKQETKAREDTDTKIEEVEKPSFTITLSWEKISKLFKDLIKEDKCTLSNVTISNWKKEHLSNDGNSQRTITIIKGNKTSIRWMNWEFQATVYDFITERYQQTTTQIKSNDKATSTDNTVEEKPSIWSKATWTARKIMRTDLTSGEKVKSMIKKLSTPNLLAVPWFSEWFLEACIPAIANYDVDPTKNTELAAQMYKHISPELQKVLWWIWDMSLIQDKVNK